MIGPVELLTLSMGVSVAVSALTLAAGSLIEARSHDPVLRDRIWGAALILSLTPVLAVAILLLTPAPVREVSLPTLVPIPAAAMIDATPVAVATGDIAPDFGLLALALLGAAAALVGLRAIGLALRSVRLALILREAGPAGAVVARQVTLAAATLGVAAPTTLISAEAAEALLSGLGRARLILPESLAPEATDAVIAHELAHLKRGDHRMLWLEEVAAVLLAFNPVVPLIRAKRDGAREEACDALALGDAAPEARRAYAQTLIEALRNRAGSQSPALTFTGAGRTTAMRRLKAVMTPAAPAGRRTRLIAGAAGLALLTTVGGATAALAGQREAEVRVIGPVETQEPQRLDARGHRQLLNGQPLPAGLPVWALNPERVDIRTTGEGAGAVDFILPFTGTTPVSVNGQRLPDGFPVRGINPEAVARVDMQGDHMILTLRPEGEVRGRAGQDPVQDAAAAEARNAERAETSARYRRASATDLKTYCLTSDDAGDYGFCAGTMLARLERPSDNGLCLPTIPSSDGAALTAYVERGKAQMARLTPRRDEGAYEYATRAL